MSEKERLLRLRDWHRGQFQFMTSCANQLEANKRAFLEIEEIEHTSNDQLIQSMLTDAVEQLRLSRDYERRALLD